MFEILKTSEVAHQYIVTTHSTDVISFADPDELLLMKLENEQSGITAIQRNDIAGQRTILDAVGARLSDVFGADRVLWVEGLTEQTCFPKVVRHSTPQRLLGTVIVAVRNTGDLEAKRDNGAQTWEIYQRLSTVGGLLPVNVAFSLDNEGRSEATVEDLKRRSVQSGTRLEFLPRRTYENYLIDPEAITAVLGRSEAFRGSPLAVDRVRTWIIENGAKFFSGRTWDGELADEEWLAKVNAPALLADLFADVSGATEGFDKMVHSVAITEWLLEHRPDHLRELADYLSNLLE